MKQRIISALLLFTMILSLSACKKTSSLSSKNMSKAKTEKEKSNPINLIYNKSDSFNPYTAVTDNNRNLCNLIFEPLIKTDNNLNPEQRLASNVSLNGTTCTVTIIDALFSDGSKVTADDVVYSFNLAKNYGGIYSTHLYEVVSATATSQNSITFTLSRIDPYFKNLLDFPIIKSGSDKTTDSDGVLLSPIGCGRYCLSENKTKFILNDNFFGKKGKIKEIKLINAPDDDSISHYIEVGAAEFYYNDLSNSNIVRMSGKKADVNLNNLVYLGVNQQSSGLSSKDLRYAISSAIDRLEVADKAYFNNATPATGYFNPCLDEVKAVQSIKTNSDEQITIENLAKLGYNSKDSEGYFVNNQGKRIVLRLLVNTENRFRVVAANLIASQLKTVGIEIKVIETSFTDYTNCINSNAFDLYLGEVSILPNFDISPLVVSGGSMAFGVYPTIAKESETSADEVEDTKSEITDNTPIPENNVISNIINSYYSGNATLSDVSAAVLTEMPQIPLLYRNGVFFYKDNIISGVESSKCDIYYSIEKYKTK